MNKQYWFKRKRYGWGWIPVTWQGWLTIGVFATILVGGAAAIGVTEPNEFTKELGFYLLFVAVAVAMLIRVGLDHGPRPRWRWGRSENDNRDEDF